MFGAQWHVDRFIYLSKFGGMQRLIYAVDAASFSGAAGASTCSADGGAAKLPSPSKAAKFSSSESSPAPIWTPSASGK